MNKDAETDEGEYVEFTVVDELKPSADASTPADTRALADLRRDTKGGALGMTVDRQKKALAEYKKRRDHFRQWLLSNMEQGVHYGFPPGCEPVSRPGDDGDTLYRVWDKRANGGKGAHVWHSEKLWKPKHSLYEAGADLIIDLLNVKVLCEPSHELWVQEGSVKGSVAFRAVVVHGSDSATSIANASLIIGEGYGGCAAQERKGFNTAVKIARKRAKVAAVRDAYGLADLFTQDLEDGDHQPPNHANPGQSDKAPRARTRDDDDLNRYIAQVCEAWKEKNPEGDRSEFKAWVQEKTGRRDFDPGKSLLWTLQDVDTCLNELGLGTVSTQRELESVGAVESGEPVTNGLKSHVGPDPLEKEKNQQGGLFNDG